MRCDVTPDSGSGVSPTGPVSRRAAKPPSHRADEPPSARAPGHLFLEDTEAALEADLPVVISEIALGILTESLIHFLRQKNGSTQHEVPHGVAHRQVQKER